MPTITTAKKINLGARFQKAFGYVPTNESDELKKNDFNRKASIDESKVYKSGNTMLDVVTLVLPNSNRLVFGDMLNSSTGLKNIFAPPLMLSWSRNKRLIETEIDGGDGVVVERYNSGQWVFRCEGLLIDMEEKQFPLKQLQEVTNLFAINDILPVESLIMDALKVKSLYITSMSGGMLAGFEDTVSISFEAKSIRPIEFFLNNIEQ